MLLDDLIARVAAASPDLAGRVEGAAELARLMADDQMPEATPAAFVLPLGLDAGPQIDATGVHEQIVNETYGVILVLDHADDAMGAKALTPLHVLNAAIVRAVAGWQPQGADDSFALKRGRLLDARAGRVVWQTDFTIASLLRIS